MTDVVTRSNTIELKVERPLFYPLDGSESMSRTVELTYTIVQDKPGCYVQVNAAYLRADGSYGIHDWRYTWWNEAALQLAPRWVRGLLAAHRPQWHIDAKQG